MDDDSGQHMVNSGAYIFLMSVCAFEHSKPARRPLIDDKYQSRTTIQYVVMKLQQEGAYRVFELSVVKTMKDTDNQ